MNTYSKKRYKSGLAKSDVAKELGIDYNAYDMIEKGRIKMPTRLIDKFNEIIKRKKREVVLEKLENNKKVEEWYDEMVQKDANGKLNIYAKLKEFNIPSINVLSKKMGYKNSTCVYRYIKYPSLASYDWKNRLYLFFENELNMEPIKPTNNVNKTKKVEKILNAKDALLYNELKDWFNDFDLKNYVNKTIVRKNITANTLAKEIGFPPSTLHRLLRDDGKILFRKNLTLLKNYVDENPINEDIDCSDLVFPEIPSKPTITSNSLELKIKSKIEKLEKDINDRKSSILSYEEAIRVIELEQNELITELRLYKELLAENEHESEE